MTLLADRYQLVTRLCLLLSYLLVQGCLASFVQAQVDSKAEPKPSVELSGEVFKNVTALAEMPADQMGKVMNIMSASLSVNCQFCHEGYDFAKEKVAHKDISRKMIEMTLDLNAKYFDGRNEVTCFTCHRGKTHPANGISLEPVAVTQDVRQPEAIPTVEAIVSKYIAALGGQERLAALKNRHIVAKRIEPDGRSEPEELWQSADGTYRLETTYKSVVVTEAFDGKTATKKANADVIQLKFDEALQVEREASLGFGIGIRSAFEAFSYTRVEEVDGRRMFVLKTTDPNRIREQLYIDEQTSLLSRRTAYVPTILGEFVYQVDYQSYKSFDGVQIPTTLRFSVPNITWTREVSSVEHK